VVTTLQKALAGLVEAAARADGADPGR
jgi:hypothetical protein